MDKSNQKFQLQLQKQAEEADPKLRQLTGTSTTKKSGAWAAKKSLLNAASSSIRKSARKAATNGLSSMKVLKKPKAKSA